MHKLKYLAIITILVITLLSAVLSFNVIARSQPAVAPVLGTAASFAVLGGSTTTNTGSSIINGDLGVSPGLAYTGFPPGIVVPPGVIHAGDAVAQLAQNDTTAAYDALAGQACNVNLTGLDLGGLILTPGVYCFNSSAQLTGALTLNAQGDPNSVFVFQIGSALTTATNSSIVMINGGSACNVFWKIGSSATIGTTTSFKGNILALTSITLNTGANIIPGRALARNGAVTMDTNNISMAACTTQSTPAPAATQTAAAATLTAIGLRPTQTLPASTRTAIVLTQTNVAATNIAIAPSLTAIALTNAPSLTAQAVTQTATVRTPTTAPTTVPPAATMTTTRLPVVVGLPSSGAAPLQDQDFPWSLVIVGGFSVIGLALGLRAYRSADRSK